MTISVDWYYIMTTLPNEMFCYVPWNASQHDKTFLPENVEILISTVTIHNKWKS